LHFDIESFEDIMFL